MITFFYACDIEEVNQNETDSLKALSNNSPSSARHSYNFTFNDGRLVFASKRDLETTISALKSLEYDELKNVFSEYYNQGFLPAYPYYDDDDTQAIQGFFDRRKLYLPKSFDNVELEFDDPLISDDIFASLLNYKREIQVENKIYAYTFSGLLIVDKADESDLIRYINNNNIYDSQPDPTTLPPGSTQLTNEIELYVTSLFAEEINPCHGTPNSFTNQLTHNDLLLHCQEQGGYGGGWSTGGGTPNLPPDHTENMLQYVNTLEECNYDDAGIFGFTPFGTRKVCYKKFSSGVRRTKTLYSNEDYGIYAAVKIKVKHQRRHSVLFVVWWASKKTDEIALIIDQATFRVTPGNMEAPVPNFDIPSSSQNKMLIYTGNLVFGADQNGVNLTGYPVPANKYPSTPFDEDVIVQFFNEDIVINDDMNLAVNDINNIFWNLVYDQTKSLFNNLNGEDPKRITLIIPDEESVEVRYVDLGYRKLNSKKIVETLDQDWGIEFKFTLSLDGNNSIITDPSQIYNVGLDNINLGDLTDFEDIYMDFTGLSRNNSEWRGSKMVYKAF